jgi:FkbM family methyltransferase
MSFFDIGANIGYITAYGANLVGQKGQVHCFEPIKEYFDYISSVIKLNPEYDIHLNNLHWATKNTRQRSILRSRQKWAQIP